MLLVLTFDFREVSVRTLNVDTKVFLLHLSRLLSLLLFFVCLFMFLFGSVSDFSNTVAGTGTTAERAPC